MNINEKKSGDINVYCINGEIDITTSPDVRKMFDRVTKDKVSKIVLNLEKLSIATACQIVADTIARPDFAPTDESTEALRKLVLKSRVVAALAADPRTADAHVDVLVEGEVITLQGFVRLQSALDAVREVAAGAHGVKHVDCQVVVRTGFPI